jgi:hypothetical protein
VVQDLLQKDGGDDDHGGDDNGDDNSADIKVYARLVSRPDGTDIGTWVIGDTSYTVNAQTLISNEHGPFTIGGCVEVESTPVTPTVAKKLGSEKEDKCAGVPNGGDSGGDNNSGGDNSDDIKAYARLVSRPTGTDFGNWIIGDKSYTVNEQTVISTLHGPFTVGGCVEVEVNPATPTIAKELGSEEDSKCTSLPGDDNSGDDNSGDDNSGDDNSSDDNGGDDNGGDSDTTIRFGYLSSRPTGIAGDWIIDGDTYSASEQTELDSDHGAIVIGICVKVKSPTGNPTFAKEIESEEDYKCSGRTGDDGSDDKGGSDNGSDDSRAEGKLYGLIEAMPASTLQGLWLIGGKSISVTAQTELNDEGGVFTLGSLVKVEFYTTLDESNIAKEVELKYSSDSSGDDRSKASLGKIYALLESRPAGSRLGIWKIGGVDYLADSRTEFDDATDDAAANYGVGDRVKVKYNVQSDGSRRAVEIEKSDDDGGVDDASHSKIVGFVESKPAGFVGLWLIAGAEFQADLSTTFHEDDGLFVKGAYVEVEYLIGDNTRMVHKMETRVPPGAGDQTRFGAIESTGSSAGSVTVSAVSAESWTIGGQSYAIGAATNLDDTGGALAVGAQVLVNSYLTVSGVQTATEVRAVTLNKTLRIPFAVR